MCHRGTAASQRLAQQDLAATLEVQRTDTTEGNAMSLSNLLETDTALMNRQFWEQADREVFVLPTVNGQKKAWQSLAKRIDADGHTVSKGHPYFRLGHLHLEDDPSEQTGLDYLRKAFEEDKVFGPRTGQLPKAMGAYLLLSFVEDFLAYLNDVTTQHWMRDQLNNAPNRKNLFNVLLTIYNESLRPRHESQVYTHRHFSDLFKDAKLLRFAVENYQCANSLVSVYFAQTPWLTADEQYALARATIGLYGATLEAVLADWFPPKPSEKPPTLGKLVDKARTADPQVIKDGTALAALSIFLLYFRNLVHPDREIKAKYDIGMQNAKGVGIALGWALGELSAIQHS